jgi:hypothetical protein
MSSRHHRCLVLSIDTVTLGVSSLASGANVVAVEIHQADASSSDISFDLSLTGRFPPPPPELHWYWFGDPAWFLWSATDYTLEWSTEIDGGPFRGPVRFPRRWTEDSGFSGCARTDRIQRESRTDSVHNHS